MITNILATRELSDYKNTSNPKLLPATNDKSILAIYSQNYLFLKHILKLEKQNQEIIEQNKQTIEQNQEIIEQGKRDTEQNQKIIEQNQQIIDLLAKIESKQ